MRVQLRVLVSKSGLKTESATSITPLSGPPIYSTAGLNANQVALSVSHSISGNQFCHIEIQGPQGYLQRDHAANFWIFAQEQENSEG